MSIPWQSRTMWAAVMALPKLSLDAPILAQEKMADAVYHMTVHCPGIAAQAQPGSFVQIRLLGGDILLRRPLGIADADAEKGTITFIYRILGKGTSAFSNLCTDDKVNVLGPLGHGFSQNFKKPLIVGGGMGLSPLLFYAKAMGKKADVLMGGKTASEMFWAKLFEPHVSKAYITTDDGSLGTKGFTVSLLPELLEEGSYDAVIVCGPEIMMRKTAELAREAGISCQVSLEKRMACGLGACLSCSIDATDGTRRKVCKDGPVFWAEEVF